MAERRVHARRKNRAVASPVSTVVPASRTLRDRSRSLSGAAWRSRETGLASPVNVALFTRTPNASSNRQSAGTSSPAERKITSPGTTSSDGMTTTRTITARAHATGQQPLQGGHRPLRPVFLPEGKGAVDQNDGHDGHAERAHALTWGVEVGTERQRGGTPQQRREDMRERFVDRQLVNEHRWTWSAQLQCLHHQKDAAKKHPRRADYSTVPGVTGPHHGPDRRLSAITHWRRACCITDGASAEEARHD